MKIVRVKRLARESDADIPNAKSWKRLDAVLRKFEPLFREVSAVLKEVKAANPDSPDVVDKLYAHYREMVNHYYNMR